MIYSYSRLSTFEKCPYKFKLKYIEKIPPEIEQTIEAHLGKSVHDTLEWIYNTKLKSSTVPNIDETITHYSKTWGDTISPTCLIVKPDLTFKDYFNQGVHFILNYYTKNQPFNDGTIECEKRIVFSLDSNNEFKIQGFIDRLAKNPTTNTFEIHDYKTGNSMPTQKNLDTDKQLALYSIAIKQEHGQHIPVSLIWHYLAHNQKLTSQRTNQQLQNLKLQTIKLIQQIESTENFPAAPSALCDWCEYQNMCPKFSKQKSLTSWN